MYYWKCWRDTRSSFYVYLSGFFLLALCISCMPLLTYSNETGYSLQFPRTEAEISKAWQLSTALFGPAALMIAMVAGVGLGATGVGAEFPAGTLELLLTRPRRRRYFVWGAWAVAVLQMAALIVLYVLLSFAGLAVVTGRVTPRIFILLPLTWTAGAAAIGVAYLATLLGREAKHGLMVGLLLVFTYPPVVTVVRLGLDISLPTPWSLVPNATLAGLGRVSTAPFPYASMAGWLLFAIALPWLARLLFDRAEV